MSLWNAGPLASLNRRRVALWALCGALPLLGLGSQVAAKHTALILSGTPFGTAWFSKLVTLPTAWTQLGLEVATFGAWMTVLSTMKLSAAFPMTALGYVLVIAASWSLFHEPASLMQALGGAAILAGIWLIADGEAGASETE